MICVHKRILCHIHAMNISRVISSILLATFLVGGCSTPNPAPDPLAGWREMLGVGNDPDKAITDDYQSYIQSLTPEERKSPSLPHFYVDGKGQHAIRFEVIMNGAGWAHVLIYDKEDKRIKVIKYFRAFYRS